MRKQNEEGQWNNDEPPKEDLRGLLVMIDRTETPTGIAVIDRVTVAYYHNGLSEWYLNYDCCTKIEGKIIAWAAINPPEERDE